MNCKNNFTVLLFVSLVALMLSCSQAQNKKGTSTGIKTGSSISDQNVSADKNRLVGIGNEQIIRTKLAFRQFRMMAI